MELAKESRFAPGTENPIPRLIEASVLKQVENIKESTVFIEAYDSLGQGTDSEAGIHGWVFDLATGQLKVLSTPTPN